MDKFNISQFETAFYKMLFDNSALDSTDFNRKICYHGRILRVRMENARIVSIVDLSGIHPVLLHSIEAVSA